MNYFNIYIIVCGVAAQFALLYALYRFIMCFMSRDCTPDEHEDINRVRG